MNELYRMILVALAIFLAIAPAVLVGRLSAASELCGPQGFTWAVGKSLKCNE